MKINNFLDMKKHITFGLLTLCMAWGIAQRHEIGVKIGATTVSGDAKSQFTPFPQEGTKRRVHPSNLGLFYKRNLNPRQAIRLDLAYNIAFFDNLYERRIKVSNDVLEASLMFEYAFFSINDELARNKTKFSPYVFGGLSGLYMDAPSMILDVTQSRRGGYDINTDYQGDLHKKKFTMAIPFGVGVKYKFNYSWSIFAELMLRYTFTENIDYSNLEKLDRTIRYSGVSNTAEASDAVQQYINNRKGKSSNDWLNSLSVGVSYAFGRPPCYCK